MEEVKDLRKAVIEYIQNADEKVVKMVHAMLEVDAEEELWDEMPDSVKADVEAALQESERSEGMSHDEVKKNTANGLQDNVVAASPKNLHLEYPIS